MNAFRRAVDLARLIFGANPRRTLSSEQELAESRSLRPAAVSKQQAGELSPTQLESEAPGASDKRAPTEIQRYEYVPITLETRVQVDRAWLNCLVRAEPWQSLEKPNETELKETELSSTQLSARLFDLISHFSTEYNNLAGSKISLTPPSDVSEKVKKSKNITAVETTESVSFRRWRASTASWSLTGRSRGDTIEIYLVPASDVMMLSGAEAPIRLKLRLEQRKVSGHFIWTCDGLPVSSEELRVLMRFVFRDLVSTTQDQAQPSQSGSFIGEVVDAKLARSMEQLFAERENLAQKVVIQQEEIQKRIARDLHDAVISDVMAIKRNLASGKAMPRDISDALDAVVQRLREICYDLSPRDLSDWGLATVVEDMLEMMAQRTGADCSLNCDIDFPAMPSAVQLHIYRIIQESLNNAEKYARPTRVVVTMENVNNKMVVLIADDGKGFDTSAGADKPNRAGGYGMGSLRERADLIRCFYPTRLDLQSAPGKGTRVRLEIDISGFR